jgi:staphylococcal nuclease domain-containing protein 1
LRRLVVGKTVKFETLKQGASAGDRVYGWLWVKQDASSGDDDPAAEPIHLGLECVKEGWGTPKAVKYPGGGGDAKEADPAAEVTPEQQYEADLMVAYHAAVADQKGVHAALPLVRLTKQAVEHFSTLHLVEACQKHGKNGQLTCIIEHVFDGSRLRCQVVDDAAKDYQYASFTLLLAGITAPRVGNPKADPPSLSEPLAVQARQFTLLRLLQRELPVSLIGTDKSGTCAVGTVHHPTGNIATECT